MQDAEVYFHAALALTHITTSELQVIRNTIRESNGERQKHGIQKLYNSGDDSSDTEISNFSSSGSDKICNDNEGPKKASKLWAKESPLVSISQVNTSSGRNFSKTNPF